MNQGKTHRIDPMRAVLTGMTALFIFLCCAASLKLRADAAPAQADISFGTETVRQDVFGEYEHNYVDFSVDEIEYEGYRIAGDAQNDGLFCLYTPEGTGSAELLGGSFCNVTPISGIRTITLTYKSDSELELSYGNDRNSPARTVMLPAQQEYSEQTVTLEESVSFFRLTDTQGDVHVARLDLYCEGSSPDETAQHDAEGIRYVPETDYDPYEGETLEVPVLAQDSAGNYYAADWKSYTYHSWEYCRDKIENEGVSPETYALTDPADVANYFVLFNRVPANYGIKEGNEELWAEKGLGEGVPSESEVLAVFGSDLARCVQLYDWSDGYGEDFSYREYEDTGLPLYYEFDIDIDGTYSFSHRGINRVVGFVGGFSCYDDDINTALITTDHYFTFAESSNGGFFNSYFDEESLCRTGDAYKAAELLYEEDLIMDAAA